MGRERFEPSPRGDISICSRFKPDPRHAKCMHKVVMYHSITLSAWLIASSACHTCFCRQLPVSNKLSAMLNRLSKSKDRLFGDENSVKTTFTQSRKKASVKLQNPRLKRITFHTFRHFYATMEYHRTKDILHVMKRLGHKSIDNTLIYTQLVNFKLDEWTSRRASNKDDEDALIKSGFDFVRFDDVN